jgi:hypothetical protein
MRHEGGDETLETSLTRHVACDFTSYPQSALCLALSLVCFADDADAAQAVEISLRL